MRVELIIGLVALTWAGVSGALTPANAQDPGTRFRVHFKPGTAERIAVGDLSLHNAKALGAIAGLMSNWPTGTGARFLFVASGTLSCAGHGDCSADRLLSQRANSIMSSVRVMLRQRNLPSPPNPGEATIESLGTGTRIVLPPPSAEASPVDMRVLLSEQSGGAASCAWSIAVSDPQLPPVITQRGSADALYVHNGGAIPLSPTADVGVIASDRLGDRVTPIWEFDGGYFCRAETLASGKLNIPSGDLQKLHLVSEKASGVRERELLAVEPCNRWRNTRTMSNASRGVGEGTRVVPQGTVQPSITSTVCSVSIVPLPHF
jgi:hypothetical protein